MSSVFCAKLRSYLFSDEKQPAVEEGNVLGDIKHHSVELERLKERDPEFYEYLQQNDKALLDFGNESDQSDAEEEDKEDATDEVEMDVDEQEDDEENFDKDGKDDGSLTIETVQSWKESMEKVRRDFS
jgi:nucleolar complex protein 2